MVRCDTTFMYAAVTALALHVHDDFFICVCTDGFHKFGRVEFLRKNQYIYTDVISKFPHVHAGAAFAKGRQADT